MSRTRFRSTLYRYRSSMMEYLFALLICALFLGISVPATASHLAAFDSANSPSVADSSSSREATTPRLVFTSPTFGASETGSSVTIDITLHQDQDIASLVVKLNGRDVSGLINSSSCRRKTCTMTGTVTVSNGLAVGDNQLWASITSIGGGSGDTQWTSFDYSDELSSGTGNSIKNYDPASVGISTVTPSGAAPWIQITTGSTMNVSDPVTSSKYNFPTLPSANNKVSIPYPDMQYKTDCTTIFQAIVLNRKKPSDQEATGCGDTIIALETNINDNLQSARGHLLGDGDLVILGTTSGNIVPPGLITTDFGGTDYSHTLSTLYPQKYMLIGVVGATHGTAHESYDIAKSDQVPYRHDAFIDGTLMKDGAGNYNYVPSDDQLFSVISGQDAKSTSVTVGVHTYTAPSNSSGAGEFWLLVLDRTMLQPVNYPSHDADGAPWVPCADGLASQSCGGIFPASAGSNVVADLQTTLGSISPRSLVFLVAAGCPFQNAAQVSNLLGGEIYTLGGVQYSMLKLTTGSSTCAYSLVSVNDQNHHDVLTGNAALSANQFTAQQQTGALQGYLARGKSGLYDVAGKAQMGIDKKGKLITSVDFAFEEAAANLRVDWPLTNTSSLLAAYHDISYQLLTAKTVGELGSHDYDMRYFYTDSANASDLIAENDNGTLAALQPSSWDTATNPQDFASAKAQLELELTDLKSAANYLNGGGDGGIRGVLSGSQTSILNNMFLAAQDISVDQPQASSLKTNANFSNALNLAAGVTSVLAAVGAIVAPPIGAAIGVLSGALWAGSAAASFGSGSSSSIPGPENYYDTTLTGLSVNASSYANSELAGFDGAVDNIFTDWNKLQTVSGHTLNSDSGWNIPESTALDNLSTILVSGAERSIWLDVLPNLYGTRLFFAGTSSDPSSFGSYTTVEGIGDTTKTVCLPVYKKVPTASVRAYPTVGFPNLFDVVILGEGTAVKNNFTENVSDTPVSSDLAQYLTTSQNVAIGGNSQPGLNITPDVLFNNGPLPASVGAQFSDKSCAVNVGVGGVERASFAITPAPKAETIRRGDIGLFVLQLKSVNGFKGNVRLTCSGGPPDSQCGNLPQTVKVNGTAYALSGMRFSRKTAPGAYTITFNGVSGTVNTSATANFIVK